MKRITTVFISILLLLSLCACTQTESPDPITSTPSGSDTTVTDEKTPSTDPSVDTSTTDEQTNPPTAKEHKFAATVIEQTDTTVVVEPCSGEAERNSSDKITFATTNLADIDATVGDVVEITYDGTIMESYPAQISPSQWKMKKALRSTKYTEAWLAKTEDKKQSDGFVSGHIEITKIYADCFFARPLTPTSYEIKVNGTLYREWCVGDQVFCTYQNVYYDAESGRAEADMISITESSSQGDTAVAFKPVIYLYPEQKTDVSVKLQLNGKLTCTYPQYKDQWLVTAAPDGTLKDAGGQCYNYLYWEGELAADYDLSKGFCVKGKDTAKFLEEALEKLGLTRKEANEFIVFWLPMMQENPYNIISFQTKAYTDAAKLDISPAPDTLLRVFMTWKASETYKETEKQVLSAPERKGFTVVEWGGTEITK